MRAFSRACVFLLLAVAGTMVEAADPFPNRPIHIIVGFPPGGGTDSIARMVGESMSRTFGQPVVVENRPGAGSTVAPAAVAAAAPDGYTLLLAPNSVFGTDKVLFKSYVKYDETSFTPISRLVSTFFVLAANKDAGFNNIGDLLAKGRRQAPTPMFFATPGGAYLEIINANFTKAGINLTPVPYKGGSPAVMAVMAGEVPFTFLGPGAVLPLVKEGKIKPLAITAGKRSPLTPELPTLAEAGMEGFDVNIWYALVGPAGMPADVVRRLFDATTTALNEPAVRQKLAALGYDTFPSKSPEEFRDFALRDGVALRNQVRALDLKTQ